MYHTVAVTQLFYLKRGWGWFCINYYYLQQFFYVKYLPSPIPPSPIQYETKYNTTPDLVRNLIVMIPNSQYNFIRNITHGFNGQINNSNVLWETAYGCDLFALNLFLKLYGKFRLQRNRNINNNKCIFDKISKKE